MRTALVVCLSLLLLIGGCPQPQGAEQSAVVAQIGSSRSRGPVPLTVSFTAAGSWSRNGGPLTYAWDFKDGTTSDDLAEIHVFEQPGRYVVELTVTDPLGESSTATLDVRVAGTGATAIIESDVTSGRAPLPVQFDGTESSAPDDTILDYYWDFGDGETSRSAKPWHTFDDDGEFTVTLKVVTAGGVEAETQTTIIVGVRNAALQFDGGSFATLPVAYSDLAAYTFEAWVEADTVGGTLATLGDGVLAIELAPTSNTIHMRVNGVTTTAAIAGLAGDWKHVAVVCTSSTEPPGGDPGTGGNVTSCIL